MVTVNNINLGRLDRGEVETRKGFMAAGSTRIDNYAFSTGSAPENVAISSTGSTKSVFGLQLFRDVNANGVVDSSDTFVRSNDGTSDVANANESMNVLLGQGNYVARFQSFAVDNISYDFRIARARTNANPLATLDRPALNTISHDLRRGSRINDLNTADNYAFTLDGNSRLDITARELFNKSGDVNIRVIRDLNNNQVVDAREVVAQGVGSFNGNIDSITGLTGAGNYILQVCQTQGRSNVAIKFDHSTL
jgi:hypothetical protein